MQQRVGHRPLDRQRPARHVPQLPPHLTAEERIEQTLADFAIRRLAQRIYVAREVVVDERVGQLGAVEPHVVELLVERVLDLQRAVQHRGVAAGVVLRLQELQHRVAARGAGGDVLSALDKLLQGVAFFAQALGVFQQFPADFTQVFRPDVVTQFAGVNQLLLPHLAELL